MPVRAQRSSCPDVQAWPGSQGGQPRIRNVPHRIEGSFRGCNNACAHTSRSTDPFPRSPHVTDTTPPASRAAQILSRPISLNGLTVPNRIVMAPMTRMFSPGGIPGEDVLSYYARRAAAGVGLIVTEGTYVGHESAGQSDRVPRFHGRSSWPAGRRSPRRCTRRAARSCRSCGTSAWSGSRATLPTRTLPLSGRPGWSPRVPSRPARS